MLNNKVLAIGAIPFPNKDDVDLLSVVGIRKFWRDVGGNTGNCIIGELGRQGIDCVWDNVFGEFDLSHKSPLLSEEYNRVLIFAANWLSDHYANYDCERYLDWYEKCDIGITILGLGCQTKFSLETKEDRKNFLRSISPSYIKLLSIIGEKGGISTRDEITADVLRLAGIQNVVATGCPTWFCNEYNQPRITKKNFSDIHKVCFSPCLRLEGGYQKMLSLGMNFDDFSLVIQSERLFTPFASRKIKYSDNKFSRAKLLPKFLRKGYNILDQQLMSNWCVLFSSLDTWSGYLNTCDFNFGGRIHNTILGIKSGTPSIIVTHDIRTKLMADFFQIPSIRKEEFLNDSFSLQRVYEEADFDVMNKRYDILLENYVNFLSSQDLQINSIPFNSNLNKQCEIGSGTDLRKSQSSTIMDDARAILGWYNK